MRGIALLVVAMLLTACAGVPTVTERRATADALATGRDWQAMMLPVGRFDIVAYLPARIHEADTLTIYIEGDGLAWLSSSTASSDPTPVNPVGLKLALAHPQGNAVYLARPCQYLDTTADACPRRYWTGARFAPEVIDASNRALEHFKARFGASRLILVGYSGGGAVAALLAGLRDDVDHLVTVAGNLDPQAWAAHHHITPLYGSLNPAERAQRLTGIRQTHFVGGRDRVIPPVLTEHYPAAIRGIEGRNLHLVPEFDHRCCWAEEWPRLYRSALP